MNTAEKVLNLFLAGATYPQIAQATGLDLDKVHSAVVDALAAQQDRRNALQENYVAVHRERTEALFRAHWGPALRGDHKSAEICNRILERQLRIVADLPQAIESDAVDEIAARRAARRRTKMPG